MAERLPVVGGDDGSWGTVLNNWLLKEHYDTNDGNTNASNGMHKGVTIRAGTASVAPLTFTTTSAALLTTPAAGTLEIDSSGLLYYTQTTGSGNRRRVMYYDATSAATGDIFYRDSSGDIVRLGIGSSSYVLTVNSGLPSWQPASAGSPGGSDGQVQYKSGSSFAGAAGLAYQSGSSPNVTITAQNSAHVPLRIAGAASQSANLLELKDGSSNTTASFAAGGSVFLRTPVTNSTTAFQIQDSSGSSNLFVADTTTNRLGIGTTTTTNGVINLAGTAPSVSGGQGSGLYINTTLSSTSYQQSGVYAAPFVYLTTGSPTNNYVGFMGGPYLQNSGATSLSGVGITGISATPYFDGSGTGGNTLGIATGVGSQVYGVGGGTISFVRTLYADNPSLTGGTTIGTSYGIQVAPQTAASSNYGVAIGAASTQTLWVSQDANNTTAAAGVAFGSSRDTNLYRSAADTLATDDDINIKGGKALKLDGSSSGTVTVNTAATAGTWSLTLPTGTGSSGQFLKTNGSGVTSWGDVLSLAWTEVTGTSQSATVNNGYIASNASLVTVTLPSSAALGDMIRIVGKGAGGWKLTQNSGQKIYFGNVSTTTGTGGYLQSVVSRDAVTVICVTANNDWEVISAQGNITYV